MRLAVLRVALTPQPATPGDEWSSRILGTALSPSDEGQVWREGVDLLLRCFYPRLAMSSRVHCSTPNPRLKPRSSRSAASSRSSSSLEAVVSMAWV